MPSLCYLQISESSWLPPHAVDHLLFISGQESATTNDIMYKYWVQSMLIKKLLNYQRGKSHTLHVIMTASTAGVERPQSTSKGGRRAAHGGQSNAAQVTVPRRCLGG
jgi:hypothetical protein